MFEFEIQENMPTIYNNILEFQTFGKIEEDQFAVAKEKGENFVKNNYILTMLDPGLDRIEKFLELSSTDDMSLEERRTQLYTTWNTFLPLTYRYLINSLNLIFGEDNYTINTDFNNYAITIEMTTPHIDSVVRLCQSCIPMNIIWTVYYVHIRKFSTERYQASVLVRSREKSFTIVYRRQKKLGPNSHYTGPYYVRSVQKSFE